MGMQSRPVRRKYVNLPEKTVYNDGRISESVLSAPAYFESILSDDNPSEKGWKEVIHEKASTVYMLPNTYQVYFTFNDWEDGIVSESHVAQRSFDPIFYFKQDVMQSVNDYLVSHPPDWDRVARQCVPSLRNEFNTINFLLEIDDIPKMAKSLRDKALALKPKGFRNRLAKAAKREIVNGKVRSDKFSVARGTLTDNYLEYQLGVKPLLSDAETLNDNLLDLLVRERKKARKIERAFQKLESGLTGSLPRGEFGGRTFVVHKSAPLAYGQGWIEWDARVTFKIIDHVRVVGSFGGPNPVAQLLDMAGFYPDLHTLWNAVPFSFLVDYVLPVGDTLEAEFGSWSWQTVGLPGGGLRLVRAMTSIKLDVSFVCRYNNVGVGPESFSMTEPIQSNGFDSYYYIGEPGFIHGKYSYYTRYFVDNAELDGIDLSLDQLGINKTEERQQLITAGIIHNAALSGGKKTRKRFRR